MMIKAYLGNRIRSKRRDAHMTQQELAERLGICRSTVSSWEVDRTEPSIQDVIMVAEILGCSASEILGDYEARLRAEQKEQDEFRIFKMLSEGNRAKALSFIEYLLNEQRRETT